MHHIVATQPTDPLINHEALKGPWQKMGAGFMDWDDIRYLLIIDYFSKYPFLFQILCTTANTVISHVKELFSFKGMPLEDFTDSEQPFSSKQWYNFTDKYGFKHATLSLHHPHLSGFI